MFYINTDSYQDLLTGICSIAVKHCNYFDIARKTNNFDTLSGLKCNNVTTLLEYGMNPGLISSFVLKGIDDIALYFIKKI